MNNLKNLNNVSNSKKAPTHICERCAKPFYCESKYVIHCSRITDCDKTKTPNYNLECVCGKNNFRDAFDSNRHKRTCKEVKFHYYNYLEDERLPPEHVMDELYGDFRKPSASGGINIGVNNGTVNNINISVTLNVFDEKKFDFPSKCEMRRLINCSVTDVLTQIIKRTFMNPISSENHVIKFQDGRLMIHTENGWQSDEKANLATVERIVSNLCMTIHEQHINVLPYPQQIQSKFLKTSRGLISGPDSSGYVFEGNECYKELMAKHVIELFRV